MTADPGPSPPPRHPAAPAGPLLEQRFDAGSLYALRAAVSAHAAAAGLSKQQVSDAGPARRDDSGIPPRAVPWPARHGHGLWIVAQVTDKSSIDHSPAGTT